MKTIEIDGATGEGGGQILRTALSLSMCTGHAISVTRIRAKRPKPGLMRQHLTCVHAAAAVSGAQVEGAEPGSQDLRFTPGAVRAGDYEFQVGTAGSCMLVLQTVLPALMLAPAPSRVRLGGGTHNPLAPSFHFLDRCFAPLLRRLGVALDLTLHRHGFYPAGGGQVEARIEASPDGLHSFDILERGLAVQAYAESLVAAVPHSVADRELAVLGSAFAWPQEQLRHRGLPQQEGPGNALMATLAYEHVAEVVTAFGERGVSAEKVAGHVVKAVRAFQASEGALGVHLADQWLLPLALAVADQGGAASFTCTGLSEHATTNIGVIEQFLPLRFTTELSRSAALVRCERLS